MRIFVQCKTLACNLTARMIARISFEFINDIVKRLSFGHDFAVFYDDFFYNLGN